MDEDAQPLEEPIIAPLKHKRVELREREALEMKVRQEYLLDLMGNANLVRNVAVAGHLHHGKTTFIDMLVEQTHHVDDAIVHADDRALRYTDTRLDEQDREVSIKAVPMSLVMPNGAGKHLLFNMMDTPGHVNFSDEVTACYRFADAVLLVVDAVEGVMCGTERLIKHAAKEHLPICVFVNKVDRLVLELKLPPADAYHKIKHVLEEINAVIEASYGADENDCPFADPVRGTVCFGSALYGWSFTLESFARLYAKARRLPDLDMKKFAARLWGDVYFHDRARTFKKKPPPEGGERSFVQFILEPLYKIYSQAVGEDAESFAAALAEFGVALKPKEFEMNTKPLLKLACRKIFGDASGWWTCSARTVPHDARGRAREGRARVRRPARRRRRPRRRGARDARVRRRRPPCRDDLEALPQGRLLELRRARARHERDAQERPARARPGRGVLARRRGGLRGSRGDGFVGVPGEVPDPHRGGEGGELGVDRGRGRERE